MDGDFNQLDLLLENDSSSQDSPERCLLKQYSMNFRRNPAENSPFPIEIWRKIPGIGRRKLVTPS